MLHDLNFWRTTALVVTAIGQTAFVLLYLFFPWWNTFLGRAMFTNAVALVAIIDFAALSRLFDFGANDKAFAILYGVLGIGVWAQLIAFAYIKLGYGTRKFPETGADQR